MLSKTERAYFKAAKAVAEMSDHPQHQLGCIVVKNHHIISSGCNSITKCHPLQARLDSERFGVDCPGKLHSESAALIPLIKDGVDLNKASIYIYREHKDGSLALAKPCPSCQRLIKKAGIKKIYYTVENGVAMENSLKKST